MKKIIILFIILINFLLINICFSQWIQQVSGTSSPLYNVRFINENTGWICGQYGTILKTTNGGSNWTSINSPVNVWFLKIFPVNQNTVYCMGYFGTIIKSTNGGTDWTVISSNSGYDSYKACFFINEETGWIGSHDFRVLKTTNGGNSFDTVKYLGGIIKDIYFKNPLEGVLCGESGNVKKTTNGGQNWYQSNITMSALYSFCSLSFVNAGTGWLFNDYSRIYKTTNFGTSWDSISSIPYTPNVIINTGQFTSMHVGYACGSGYAVFKSTNGGYTWYNQDSITGGALSISFISDFVGYKSGSAGRIYKTTNGGSVFVNNFSGEIPDRFSLSQNYPNPFNPTTIIKFTTPFNPPFDKGGTGLETRRGEGFVTLKVFDILGKEIATLVNEKLKPGEYEVTFNGSTLPSGVYFYKLQSGDFTDTKKLVLLK